MPIYIYQNPKTEEHIEVVQRMKDEHIYVDKNGLEWNRVWFVPNASIDENINIDSANDFVNKTEGKNYTMGEAWDRSRELSEKRKGKYGYDPVKKQRFNDYRKACKKRGGKEKPHPLEGSESIY